MKKKEKEKNNTDSFQKEYRKAYALFDRFCTSMPREVNSLRALPNDSPAVQQALEDRVTEHRIEQDIGKSMNRVALFKKYGIRLHRYESHLKEKIKNKGRTKE